MSIPIAGSSPLPPSRKLHVALVAAQFVRRIRAQHTQFCKDSLGLVGKICEDVPDARRLMSLIGAIVAQDALGVPNPASK